MAVTAVKPVQQLVGHGCGPDADERQILDNCRRGTQLRSQIDRKTENVASAAENGIIAIAPGMIERACQTGERPHARPGKIGNCFHIGPIAPRDNQPVNLWEQRSSDMVDQPAPFIFCERFVRSKTARLPAGKNRAQYLHASRWACQARCSAMKVDMK